MKFPCPNCAQRLEADSSMVGMQITCPICTTTITIPRSGESASAHVASNQQLPDGIEGHRCSSLSPRAAGEASGNIKSDLDGARGNAAPELAATSQPGSAEEGKKANIAESPRRNRAPVLAFA